VYILRLQQVRSCVHTCNKHTTRTTRANPTTLYVGEILYNSIVNLAIVLLDLYILGSSSSGYSVSRELPSSTFASIKSLCRD
jgi:hypothetical protein